MVQSNKEDYKISKRSFFKKIAYSTTWEDFDTINAALKIQKNEKIISITSAGDNILNAALLKPKKILAVDFNPNQNHLLKLKITAIKKLKHKKFLELIGVHPSKRRIKIYRSIRKNLNDETKSFWDTNKSLIKKGIIYNGKQERYIQLLGRYIRSLKGDHCLEELLKCKNTKQQKKFFNKNLKGFFWNLFFRIVYSKPVMLIVKDKLVFNQITENHYPKKFRSRVEKAIKTLPLNTNSFASLALMGYYLDKKFYPEYLKKENYKTLKKYVNRIEIKTGDITQILKKLPDKSYDKFNLSNVFDWVNKEEFKKNLKEIIRISRNKGRFCYYNTLMKRDIPKNLKNIRVYKKQSKKLLEKDRSFLYENFQYGIIYKKN